MPTASPSARPRVTITRSGVPVYWTVTPNPCLATVLFRVGHCDETFLTSGITHVVEHLAMSRISMRDLESNAWVDSLRCGFYAEGEENRVREFVSAVFGALADPAVDRLEREIGILMAEAQHRESGPESALRSLRFGAQGHGLDGDPEAGYSRITADSVREWAASRFTAANCVVVMNREPPDGWDPELPSGRPFPPPDPVTVPAPYPAFVAQGSRVVGLTCIGDRSPSLSMAVRILEERLGDVLRQARGRSYHVDADYEPLTASTAHCLALADCQPEHGREVAHHFWTTVEQVAEKGPEPAEVDEEITRHLQALDGDPDPLNLAHFAAEQHLLTGGPPDLDAMRARVEAVTAPGVAGALARALESALLLIPESANPPPGLAPFPAVPDVSLTGRTFAAKSEPRSAVLTVGREGVGVTVDGEAVAAVGWAACEAVLIWPNGDRCPVGTDGTRLRVCSGQWKAGMEAIAAIDENAPPRLRVEVGPDAFPAGGWSAKPRGGAASYTAASWGDDGWALVDLTSPDRRGTAPPIAPEAELAELDVADSAELALIARGADGGVAASETITVTVTAMSHEFFTGTLTRESRHVPALTAGMGIAFAPHHVTVVRRRAGVAGALRLPRWRRG